MRRIAILTESSVTFYELNNHDRPLTLVGGQMLYRTDSQYMLRNRSAPEEMVVYDLDGIVPLGVEDPPSPDETMAYIDIARGSGKKLAKVKIWPKWLTMDKIAIAIVVLLIGYNYIK